MKFTSFNFTRRWRIGWVLLFALIVLGITGMGSTSMVLAQDPDPVPGYDPNMAPSNAISFDIEGCRLDKATEGTYDPTATPPVFTCDSSAAWPDGADAYTDGNLGKQWNELDLVPHRIGSDTAGLTTEDETYQVIVGADNLVDTDPLKIGFDRVVNFEFNAALSSGSASDCQLELIGVNSIGDFGIGGAISQIVQVLEITQTADTQCVFDYVDRLAITSSLISGSSTRSFIFAGTGAQSVPIPSDIQPQVLNKTMSAVEDSLINWTLEKVASPIDWNFGNTCNLDVQNTKDVTVDITFTKGDTELGDLTATTEVDASNPSSRVVYYDCTDIVYSGDTPEDTQEPDPFGVPPGEMVMFDIEHILYPGTRDLRDELTCTLQVEDILNPGTFIDVGTLTAEFSLPNEDIAPGEVVNETLVVADTESITEGALRYDFSAVQSGGVSGAFLDGYTGDFTDGPVDWESDPQSASGTVQFTKTVRVERGYDVDGKLEDTASIDLTDTTDLSATAATTLSTDPKIDLVINKNLGFTVANDTVWKFEVKDGGDNVEANVEITIPGGSSSGSVTINDLDPDTYTVTETILDGWVPTGNPQNVTLSLPSCEGSVTFTNNPADEFYAEVEVKKMTNPTGNEAGWDFNLSGPENASVTTTDANFIRFNLDGGNNAGADAGSYSIAEVEQDGWDLQADITFSKVGCIDESQNAGPTTVETCNFDVQYERDAGCVFQCTYENIQQGKIIVEKQTDPADSPQDFLFTGDAAGTLVDNGQIVVDDLVPGTYFSTEFVPAGWDLTAISCDDGASNTPSEVDLANAEATFNLDPGETVKCTFYNLCRGDVDVTKTVEGLPPTGTESFTFQIRQGASPTAVGTVVAAATTDATNNVDVPFVCADGDPPCRNVEGVAKLVPGDYQFCEANVYPGYTTDIKDWAGAYPLPQINGTYFVPNAVDPMVDNSIYCVDFTLGSCETVSFLVDNTPPPGGDARTPGYWKNWSECTGGGQEDVLGASIECSDLGFFPIGLVEVDMCYEAVSILDMRQIAVNLKGKKKASDACYLLASKLLAAELNTTDCIGARDCPELDALMTAAQQLLVDEGFDGENRKCLRSKDTAYSDAIDLAEELDDYLNNRPGSACN